MNPVSCDFFLTNQQTVLANQQTVLANQQTLLKYDDEACAEWNLHAHGRQHLIG